MTAWDIHLLRVCVEGGCAHLCPISLDANGSGWTFRCTGNKKPPISRGFLNPSTSSGTELVRPEGFEPPTNGFGSHYSIRLSYERLAAHYARTAGVRVMGPGDASPGEPRRRSRRDDAGVSARAVAVRHRVPRFKRAGPRVQPRGHLKRPLPDASLLSTPPDSELEHAPERAHSQACVATAPPAAARPHQRPPLAAPSLDCCGQPHRVNSRPSRRQGIARIAARTAPTPRPHDHGRAALLPFAT
ncbi:hypothetical protein XFF6166_130006 [Xanthomonas citri pv. fuscans]|nr:hypothetical protein XFF6166_130006 [Xanthomonas citri pv. fuscans]SON98617.1 hypothetical protein XFF6960_100005 [Xanthomonas citri pv. fuscans]SOO08538.1 hypothetical protein XFF6970_240006 [Xanthomonas citri pv. fuscans]SOO14697.1 hypothetical protein XFF7766_340058 [Xanthomonas citri pv. fuscans]SOO44326.1 hypothetical protein XFF1815_500023 [Xanthomonas citri pv. fuscans]